MVKSRLIFTLLYDKRSYMLSRNFRLQRVGNLNWIQKHYDFKSIAFSIDELIVLNVTRENRNIKTFAKDLSLLTDSCFMPIAAGGGIRTIDDALCLFGSGADKIVINTPLIRNKKLVKELAKNFGEQSIVASIDYKICDNAERVFIDNGSFDTGLSLDEAVYNAVSLGVGEIFITSIDKDGTGQGYNLEILNKISKISPVPIIASGGVGKPGHLVAGIKDGKVQAVSTANLFNFMVGGLIDARNSLNENNISLAKWNEHMIVKYKEKNIP